MGTKDPKTGQPVPDAPTTATHILHADVPQSFFVSTWEDLSTADFHSLPSPLSKPSVQPVVRAGQRKVSHVRARVNRRDSASHPLHHRRSSRSALSVNLWSGLVGGGAAVPSDDGVKNQSTAVGVEPSRPLVPRGGISVSLFLSVPTGQLSNSASDTRAPAVASGHVRESVATALTATASGVDGEDVCLLDCSSVSMSTRHLSPQRMHRTPQRAMPLKSRDVPIRSNPMLNSATREIRTSQRTTPHTPRDTSSCARQTEDPLSPDTASHDEKSSTMLSLPFAVMATPPASPVPAETSVPSLPNFAAVSMDLMADRLSWAARLAFPAGSFSIGQRSGTADSALAMAAKRGRSSAASGAASSGVCGSMTRSDMTETPPPFGSSGFFSGPAYQCLADTLAGSTIAETESSAGGSSSRLPAPCLSAATTKVPSPHRWLIPRSSHRMSRGQKQHTHPLVAGASPPRSGGPTHEFQQPEKKRGGIRETRRKSRGPGPLIELLSCSSSDDDDDDDDAKAEENAQAQRSAADRAVFAARYKRFLRDQVAHNANKVHKPSGVGVRPSGTGFALVAFASTGGHTSMGGSGQRGSCSRHHGLVLSGCERSHTPRQSGCWGSQPVHASSVWSAWTPRTVSLHGKDVPTAMVRPSAQDDNCSLHLASFGSSHPRTNSRSHSVARSRSFSHAHRDADLLSGGPSNAHGVHRFNETLCVSRLSFPDYCGHGVRGATVSIVEADMLDADADAEISGVGYQNTIYMNPPTDNHCPFDLHMLDNAPAEWGSALNSNTQSSIALDQPRHGGAGRGGDPTPRGTPLRSQSSSHVRDSRSLPSRSLIYRGHRVSDASKFTLGGDDVSSSAETW